MTVNQFQRQLRKHLVNGKTVRRRRHYQEYPFYCFTGLSADELQKEYEDYTRNVFLENFWTGRPPNWWFRKVQVEPDRRKAKLLCRKLTVETLDDVGAMLEAIKNENA